MTMKTFTDIQLPDMSDAYRQVQEKAKKDYDGDGKIESGAKEHAGAVHNAIQKKKGLKPDGKDTRKEEVEVDEATLATARKNIGRDPKKKSCWDGYKATGTKMKGGKAVPDCKKEENETLLALLDTLDEGSDLDIYDTVVAYLIDEQLAEDFDSATKIMGTLQEELIDQVYVQQVKWLVENAKMADKAYARAKELGQKRRNSRQHKKYGSSVGKNERAAYNLSQAATDRNKSLETQSGNQTGGGSKSYGYARHKSNPVKSKSVGDTGATGHYKKRDEKITHGKKGQKLKSPRYKLSMGQRVDHHSSRRQELKDPKKNPKHTANTKK